MIAFDLTPLIGAPMADVTDHVHLLRVTAKWFCEDVREGDNPGCFPAESCRGHDASSPAASWFESEYELEHPDACTNPDECWTGRDLASEGLSTFGFPQATAVYRIQAWGSGPDYEGDYDGGIEFEAVPAPEAVIW